MIPSDALNLPPFLCRLLESWVHLRYSKRLALAWDCRAIRGDRNGRATVRDLVMRGQRSLVRRGRTPMWYKNRMSRLQPGEHMLIGGGMTVQKTTSPIAPFYFGAQ